ncbi:MAG: hypothetical protein JNL21_35680 [Myxococcales bacterium]|nr:hypothetical protein [Myxococcales bacterium]
MNQRSLERSAASPFFRGVLVGAAAHLVVAAIVCAAHLPRAEDGSAGVFLLVLALALPPSLVLGGLLALAARRPCAVRRLVLLALALGGSLAVFAIAFALLGGPVFAAFGVLMAFGLAPAWVPVAIAAALVVASWVPPSAVCRSA